MRTRSLAVLVVLAGAIVYFAWPDGSRAPISLDGGDPSLLADRVWLETLPTSPTQHVHALIALGDAPLGVFQRASAYQATIEVFKYTADGQRLGLEFPQGARKATLKYRARACSDHPPFDLCLELERNPWDGPRRYFGFRDESSAGAVIAALHHRLEHAAVAR